MLYYRIASINELLELNSVVLQDQRSSKLVYKIKIGTYQFKLLIDECSRYFFRLNGIL